MKKLLSVFVSIVLVVGLMPLPAYAELAPGGVDVGSQGQLSSEGTVDSPDEAEGVDLGAASQEAPSGEGEGIGDDSRLTAAAIGDPVTVGEVTYSYKDYGETAAITCINAPDNSEVTIPSTLTIPSGDGSQQKTVAVTALEKEDNYTNVVGNLRSLTIPTNITSIAPIATSLTSSSGGSSGIKSIIFAEGSTLDIPANAFRNVDGLTSIKLPVGSIGANAFGNETQYGSATDLSSVTWVTWPNVGAPSVTIGEGAFEGCTALASITLPDSLTTIGARAFKNSGLTSITIPNNVTEIGVSAFEGASLASGVTLGSKVETIGADAFKNAQFTSIAMPASLVSYYTNSYTEYSDYNKFTGTTAFSGCSALTTVTWAESGTGGLTAVGGFWDCPNLASDTLQNLPMWITEIDDYAFYSLDNNKWASIVIPNHITRVGKYAFEGREVQSVNIPASVTLIDEGAFMGGDSMLKHITIAEEGDSLQIEDDAFNSSMSYTDAGGVTSEGKSELVLPERVSYIGEDAFTSSQYTKFRIYNKDIKFHKGSNAVHDPFGGGINGKVYYPSGSADYSDIKALETHYATIASGHEFISFDVIPRHSITGTVPAGATVTLSVAGEDYVPTLTTSDQSATFTVPRIEEGALVYAVVSLAGYQDYTVYPTMDTYGNPMSVVMPKSDWSFTVTTANMTALSNTGTLFVRAQGDYASESRVAIFKANDGTLVAQGKVVRARFYTADSLPAGTYNVAVWQANDYFTRVSSLADFQNMGLVADTDYAWLDGTDAVQITAGQAKEIEVDVPAMDTSRIASLLKSGDVWVSNSITPPGVTFNARITYEMAGSNKAGTVTVSLPEGLDVKQVYSATHSYNASEYTFDTETRTLTVTLADTDKASGRLWLGLQAAPSNSAYTISAQIGTSAAKVPLGSANIESPAIQLVVPDGALSTTSFDVTVFTAPEATVSFAVNGTAVNTTCKTNKVGRGKATLTIPQNALSANPNYRITASVRIGSEEYSTYDTVKYSYFGGTVSPNVYEFYFKHSGGTVYLAQDGKNLSGGYYFVLAHPEENPGAFRSTWDYTAVFESAIPLLETCTLRLGMLDGSWHDYTMNLTKTENSPVKGVKRYTYRCSVKQKNATLSSDEIPYLFELVPATSDNVDATMAALEPSLVKDFGDRVAEKHAELKAEADKLNAGKLSDVIKNAPDGLKDKTYAQLSEDWADWVCTTFKGDTVLRDKLAASMGVFGYAYKHDSWGAYGQTWYEGLNATQKDAVDKYEADFDQAFELLAVAMGDKKPMPAYASYEEYLQDNYGFETGQTYNEDQLRDEGYTIIEDADTAKAKQEWASYSYTWNAGSNEKYGPWDAGSAGPLEAPSWIAVKIVDGSDSNSGISVQNSGPSKGQEAQVIVKNAKGNGVTKTFSHTAGAAQDRAVGAVGDAVGLVDGAATLVEEGAVSAQALGVSASGLKAAGQVCTVAGPVISGYQTYSSIQTNKQTVREYEERKGELDRVNQQIKFYEEHKNPDGTKTKCQIALEQERDYLEKLVKELKWVDWIAVGDFVMNDFGFAAGTTSAGLVLTGIGAPEGAALGLVSGVLCLTWSGASATGNMLLAPQVDIYTALVENQRVMRTKQCIEEEDEDLKNFAKQHYYHFQKNTLIDPSGWVFEGVEDNRLAGVKATIYQKVGDNWVEWAADEYDQENNQITDDGGVFAWDVLAGVWKVVFSKEGYQSAVIDLGDGAGYKATGTNGVETPSLSVPPAWDAIHVGLIAKAAPTVKSIVLDGNDIVVTFSQYMKTADAQRPTVTIGGSKVSLSWDSPKQGRNETGGMELMSTSLRVKVPATAQPGDTLRVAVSGGKNYAGTALTAASQDVKVPGTPPEPSKPDPQKQEEQQEQKSEQSPDPEPTPTPEPAPEPEPAVVGISMHRLYNEWSGEHFYTSDDTEFEGLVAIGWTDEGEGWKAPETSNTPVYRLYNPYAGEHHYTMDAAERDSMVNAGWIYEDIGWYSDDAKTVPLYREYNPFEFSNNHNYTTNQEEHDGLVAIGWKDEGYAWYGV